MTGRGARADYHPFVPLPRSLLAFAIAWAVASFVATVGLRSPIQPTTGSYTPAVRAMLALLAFGCCALWPAARLATATGSWPPARAALDALTIAVVLQAIFWPLHLVTHWTIDQALAIDLMLVGWTAATGAWVALGLRPGAPRTAMSLAWLCAMPAGAVLDAVGAPTPLPEVAGPMAALFALGPPTSSPGAGPSWALAAWPWTLALAGWAVATARPRPVAAPGTPG